MIRKAVVWQEPIEERHDAHLLIVAVNVRVICLATYFVGLLEGILYRQSLIRQR